MDEGNVERNGSFGRAMVKTAAYAVAMFLICVGVTGVGEARADYYRYTDGSGAVCITNNLDAVPPKYRSTMKVIREETLAKKDKGARKEESRERPGPETAPQPREQMPSQAEEPAAGSGHLFTRFPWSRPLVLVAAILAGFFLVRKLASILPSALFARVLYLAFFLGIFAFAYKSYAEHVTTSYFAIKKKVLAMFEKANRREMPEAGGSTLTAPAEGQTAR